MSYLQKYFRQVRPRNESYTPPVEKVQNLFESTQESTRMENVIVACWNNRNLDDKIFATKIVLDRDVKAWYNISKLATFNGVKLGPLKNIRDGIVTTLYILFLNY